MTTTPQYRLNLDKMPALDQVHGSVFIAIHSCWWGQTQPYTMKDSPRGIPCDPRGSGLIETSNGQGFVEVAMGNPSFYGKHGIEAFRAAFHGVLEAHTKHGWRPSSFQKWEDYNELMDRVGFEVRSITEART